MNSKKYPGLQINETNCQINIRKTGAHAKHAHKNRHRQPALTVTVPKQYKNPSRGAVARIVGLLRPKYQLTCFFPHPGFRVSAPSHLLQLPSLSCFFLRITFFDPNLLLLSKFNLEGFVNFIIHRISPSFFPIPGVIPRDEVTERTRIVAAPPKSSLHSLMCVFPDSFSVFLCSNAQRPRLPESRPKPVED